jgi:hypothetical protein
MELSFDLSTLLVLAGILGMAAGYWSLSPSLDTGIVFHHGACSLGLLPQSFAKLRRSALSLFRRKQPSPEDSAHNDEEPSLLIVMN